MLKLYFDNNAVRRHNIEQWLRKNNIPFQSYSIDEFEKSDLLRFFTKTADCFSFLKQSSWKYKLDNQITMNTFMGIILADKKRYLNFPLLETEKTILSNILVDDLSQFLPSQRKELERKLLLRKVFEVSKGRIFWANVALYRNKSQMRYLALYQHVFKNTHSEETTAADFDRFCHKLKQYRNNCLIPPKDWTIAIASFFEISVEELFEERSTEIFSTAMV